MSKKFLFFLPFFTSFVVVVVVVAFVFGILTDKYSSALHTRSPNAACWRRLFHFTERNLFGDEWTIKRIGSSFRCIPNRKTMATVFAFCFSMNEIVFICLNQCLDCFVSGRSTNIVTRTMSPLENWMTANVKAIIVLNENKAYFAQIRGCRPLSFPIDNWNSWKSFNFRVTSFLDWTMGCWAEPRH